MVWSWYSGTLAFLRHDPLFMYVQDSEQLFAQRKKKQHRLQIVHKINNDNTKKSESQHNNTDQSQSSASSTIIFIQ